MKYGDIYEIRARRIGYGEPSKDWNFAPRKSLGKLFLFGVFIYSALFFSILLIK